MEYESISSGLDAVTCLCLCTGRRRPVGGSGLIHTGVPLDLVRHTGASNGQRLVRGYLARRHDSRVGLIRIRGPEDIAPSGCNCLVYEGGRYASRQSLLTRADGNGRGRAAEHAPLVGRINSP